MYRRIFIPTKFLKGIPGDAMDEIGEPAVTRPMDALETVAVARRAVWMRPGRVGPARPCDGGVLSVHAPFTSAGRAASCAIG